MRNLPITNYILRRLCVAVVLAATAVASLSCVYNENKCKCILPNTSLYLLIDNAYQFYSDFSRGALTRAARARYIHMKSPLDIREIIMRARGSCADISLGHRAQSICDAGRFVRVAKDMMLRSVGAKLTAREIARVKVPLYFASFMQKNLLLLLKHTPQQSHLIYCETDNKP